MSKTLKLNVSFDVRAVLTSEDLAHLQKEFDEITNVHIPKLRVLIEREDCPVLRKMFGNGNKPDEVILKVARGKLRHAENITQGTFEDFVYTALKIGLKDSIKGLTDGDKTLTFSPPKFERIHTHCECGLKLINGRCPDKQ
ncbi:Gp5.5-like host HNS inhibition [Ralstonia phage RSB2]|uniref:Uncharacterized protein ORF31 n=1 Tax=Ralstonia phage RSB2 TaxID=913183 RepID=E5RV11_9CAUD|nr:Gp5.5-like host HNS inhibition [Ralstonia phage RSB2]BAJ51819.1 hypothetical protein [Ralstonia phage RSB2]